MNIGQLVTRSLVEINIGSAGAPQQPEMLALGLDTLNMILDGFNASDRKLYADLFSTFTITPNLNPHTIGPTGATWTYPIARPPAIPAASVILNSTASPYPYVRLTPLTTQQWQNLLTPGLAATLANYFYYNPTFPNGAFYFWTVAQTAYQVQIQTRQMLSQVIAATTFAQPPGYYAALMMLLARRLAGPLRKPWTNQQEEQLREDCTNAFGINAPDLLFATTDAGIPLSGAANGSMQDFNFSNGQVV